MSLPRPCRSDARSDAWPPAPKVASTTVSPGQAARSSRTSSASTGTWSAALRAAFGNIRRRPVDRGHDPACECVAELRRERETVLVIDRVLVLAEKHSGPASSFPLSATLNHVSPHRNSIGHPSAGLSDFADRSTLDGGRTPTAAAIGG